MRLIDADALLKNVDKYPYAQGLMDLIADIQTAPSIDIVRCKECKHWHSGVCWGISFNGDDASYIETEADDFCSYGERKEK